jgi:hypothetical protein
MIWVQMHENDHTKNKIKMMAVEHRPFILRILFLIPWAQASQCMCTFRTTAITGGLQEKKKRRRNILTSAKGSKMVDARRSMRLIGSGTVWGVHLLLLLRLWRLGLLLCLLLLRRRRRRRDRRQQLHLAAGLLLHALHHPHGVGGRLLPLHHHLVRLGVGDHVLHSCVQFPASVQHTHGQAAVA